MICIAAGRIRLQALFQGLVDHTTEKAALQAVKELGYLRAPGVVADGDKGYWATTRRKRRPCGPIASSRVSRSG